LLHLYGRIFFLTISITKLNGPKYCPSLTALLRSLLELYIDILLIKETDIENDIEKFFSFFDIYNLNSALKVIKIDEEIKRPIAESSEPRKIIQNKSQITKKAQELWGKDPKNIRHWTKWSLEERARKVKELEIYRNVYYYGNMYVHSGYLNYPKKEEDAHLLSSYVYCLSLEMLVKSTELLINAIDIEGKKEIMQEVTGLNILFGYFQIWKSVITKSRE